MEAGSVRAAITRMRPPLGGEPLAVLLMLGCGSYALKNRGRHLSNLPKNSEPNS